ncbi:MAG: hypothetical protein ACI9KE_001821 [Polyangiales bacterium]|jgi:hypothetical protein
MQPSRLALGFVLGLGLLCASSSAEAQTRNISVSLLAGSGVSFGTGSGQSILRHSPTHLDLAFRTWVSEGKHLRNPIVGAALRIEVEGRASVGIVPRAELMQTLGSVQIRPFVGVPFFFAPFSLLGAEVGAALTFQLHGQTNVLVTVVVDAYFWGSDLPDGQAIVSLNVGIGFELGMKI